MAMHGRKFGTVKRFRSYLAAGMAAVLCLALTACSGGTGSTAQVQVVEEGSTANDEKITLTFFGNKYEEANVRVIEEIITAFMTENPDIAVTYESLKGTDYYDALLKRMESGSGDDIFVVDHDSLMTLEAAGQVADLSGLDVIADYSDSVLTQMMNADGSVYMLPTTLSMFGLYCNTDLLEKHGREVPSTLSEWEQTCDYFVQQGITPIVANNDISLKTMATGIGFYDLYREGGEADAFSRIGNGEEKLSTYLRPGYEVAARFIEKGYIDADVAAETKKTSDDLEQFEKGESPFMLTGAWAAGRVKEADPGLDFEVCPLPVLEDGSMLVANPDVRLAVNENSANKEAAIRFVEFFTQAGNIQKFADQQCSLSPLKDSAEPSVAEIQPLLKCFDDNRVVIGSDSRLKLPIWDYGKQISGQLLTGSTVDEAMDWLDSQSEAELG